MGTSIVKAPIQLFRKYSLANGNKINKKNWHKIIAINQQPDNCHQGWPEIDKIKNEQGAYYCKWRIKKEPEGYIFREVITNSGINGHHKTVRECVWAAAKAYIFVFLED